MRRTLLVTALLLLLGVSSASVQSPTPAYIAVGDSIEFGLGAPSLAEGYVPLVAAFLSTTVFGQPVETHNFGVPFATARDIWREQVPAALAAAQGNLIVSWGGGGNDLAEVATRPQAAACRQDRSCLGRFNALLNEVEQTIDRTIGRLRQGLGPNALILMRTQYNALLKPGCGSSAEAALGNVVLEGFDGSVLDRGLNDRIRFLAEKHGARVVDLFGPFAVNAAAFVSSDCIHPSGAGHAAIATLTGAEVLAAP